MFVAFFYQNKTHWWQAFCSTGRDAHAAHTRAWGSPDTGDEVEGPSGAASRFAFFRSGSEGASAAPCGINGWNRRGKPKKRKTENPRQRDLTSKTGRDRSAGKEVQEKHWWDG